MDTTQDVITVRAKVSFKMEAIVDSHWKIIPDLTQEELDNREALMEYMQEYYTPIGYQITEITSVENL